MRTVWLLDFDGVVNIIGWKPSPWPGAMGKATIAGYRIRWAPDLVDAINKVHTSGQAEVRWATTWLENGLVALLTNTLGLGPFPAAYDRLPHQVHDDAKVEAARRVLANGDRLVWTDDAVIPQKIAERKKMLGDGSWLAVRPPETRGLSPADFDAIADFV